MDPPNCPEPRDLDGQDCNVHQDNTNVAHSGCPFDETVPWAYPNFDALGPRSVDPDWCMHGGNRDWAGDNMIKNGEAPENQGSQKFLLQIGTFIKGERLICPKCNTDLGLRNGSPPGDGSKQDYRVLGSTFDCEKCDYRFDKPNIVHFCPHCGAPFDYRTAIIRKLYSFKLSPETIELQRHEPEVAKVIKAVATIMHGRGFGVEQDVDVRGLSGGDHNFSLVATKGTVRTVVDVSTFGSQNDLVSLLGKKMDLIGSYALLVDMTGNEELSSLGKVYNIQILPPGGMALVDILGAYIDGVEQRESESPRVVVNE